MTARAARPACLPRGWRLSAAGAVLALILGAALLPALAADPAEVVKPTRDFTRPERFERHPGGAATDRSTPNRNAFSQPSANLTFEQRAEFFIGNGFFKRNWVIAPSSTSSADGLGPLYNARACQRCHLKDGRGHPPAGPADSAVSMFLRLSVPPRTAAERADLAAHRIETVPEPTYGGQLQDLAIPGVPAEGRLVVEYREEPVELAGGEVVSLRRPAYAVADPAYGPLDPATMLSPRVAPPMIGLGLLEAVDAGDILAGADPDDADGDGISGRPNQVWSLEHGRVMLGRFGWKAGSPTLMQQSSAAMTGDIGISTPLAPAAYGDCTPAQAPCLAAPDGGSAKDGGLEAGAEVMAKILFYSRNLAVPARRDLADPAVLRGKQRFYEAGCVACHKPKFVTRRDAEVAALGYQLIWPYSDLLLHDMGEGLADHRPEGVADGYEWRTAPLWGIGLTETVNGHTFFLHDGRARSLVEAILWHGGEAQPARDWFAALPAAERAALLAFLNSL
jgi:CxxC motif-containing protein (DUF1111 family)